MTLVLGTHHVCTGAGSVALGSAIGLRIESTNIPPGFSRNVGVPVDYFHIGRFNLGHAYGWGPNIILSKSSQLVFPISPEYTLLGFTLVEGLVADVYELTQTLPVVNASLMPWDRSPVFVHQSAQVAPFGTAGASLWSYVVPAGRSLVIQQANCRTNRISVSTTAATVETSITIDGNPLLHVRDAGNVPLLEYRTDLNAGEVLVGPGSTLAAAYSSSGSGGQFYCEATLNGYTYLN